MSVVYDLNSEAVYDAMTKVIGAGQAQEWDTTRQLGGVAGDIKSSTTTTNGMYSQATFALVGTSFCHVRYYFDLSETTWTDTTTAEVFNLWSSVGYLGRFGILRTGSDYFYRVGQYNDGRAGSKFNNYAIADSGPDYLEIRMVRPTNATSIDGTVTYITGREGTIGTQTGIDNYDEFPNINRVRIGHALLSAWALTNPTDFWLGKVVVRDDDVEIGAVEIPGADARTNGNIAAIRHFKMINRLRRKQPRPRRR